MNKESTEMLSHVVIDRQTVQFTSPSEIYLFIKRLFDIVFSLIAIILTSPIMIATAIAIKIDDGGTIIHNRMCVSADGNLFKMHKFRSMKEDADNLAKWLSPDEIKQHRDEAKVKYDPRITRCGKIIRKASIDELPQLFCILKGDMSFVGPRPITPQETVHYGDMLPAVLTARPGLTGNWQVNGRSNCTYASGERQKLELYYVANRSLTLDTKIFFKTFAVVLKKEGAK